MKKKYLLFGKILTITILLMILIMVFITVYITKNPILYYGNHTNNIPWEFDVVYNKANQLMDSHNIVLLGASTTVQGIIEEDLNEKLPQWKITNLATGSSTVTSTVLMINYINTKTNHHLNKSDVVVLEIGQGSVAIKNNSGLELAQAAIEYFGNYSVNKNLMVEGKPLSKIRLKTELEILKVRYLFGFLNEGSAINSLLSKIKSFIITKVSIQNTITTEKKLELYKEDWDSFMEDTTIPNEKTDVIKNLLIQLKSETNPVIVNLYTPTWQNEYNTRVQFKKWIDKDLIPFLQSNDIPYIDMSYLIPDEYYRDSSHLTMEGRELYTRYFTDKILPILQNIE